MPELEQQLRALAAELEWPATPELAPRVLPRLAPRPSRSWRPIAVALALVVVVGLGVAFAVPSARSSILRFLGIEGVTVTRVEKLPPAQPLGTLGEPTTLARVQAHVGFRPLLPDGEAPDGVYLDTAIPGDAVVLRYGDVRRPRLIVTEWRTGSFDIVKKYAGFRTAVQPVEVYGAPGIWVGAEHVVEFSGTPPRLSAPSLIWLRAPLTLRLEARVPLARALELARSVR